MKNETSFLNAFRQAVLVLGASLLFSASSFGQDVQKTNPATSAADQPAAATLKLDPVSQNAKTLFEKAHKVTLTVVQYQEKMNTTRANLVAWEKVLEHYKNDAQADLLFIRSVADGMKAKLKTLE